MQLELLEKEIREYMVSVSDRMQYPPACGARPGDTVHVRSAAPFGAAVRGAIPSWGDHDGILVFISKSEQEALNLKWHGWGVGESTLSGYNLSPWESYIKDILRGKRKAVFFRPLGIPADTSTEIRNKAVWDSAEKIDYDWGALVDILLRNVLGGILHFEDDMKFYCTEFVAYAHATADGLDPRWDVWGYDTLPTPFTTEKRHMQKRLQLVCSPGEPAWYREAVLDYDRFLSRQHSLSPVVCCS